MSSTICKKTKEQLEYNKGWNILVIKRIFLFMGNMASDLLIISSVY